jgi:hypothetical protein
MPPSYFWKAHFNIIPLQLTSQQKFFLGIRNIEEDLPTPLPCPPELLLRLNVREYLEDLDVDRRMILKENDTEYQNIDCTRLDQNTNHRSGQVKMARRSDRLLRTVVYIAVTSSSKSKQS